MAHELHEAGKAYLPVFVVCGVIRGPDQTVPWRILSTVVGALHGRCGCRK